MSEFDLTMRSAMRDDSLFYGLLEMARNKGQSLQEFFISLGRKEFQLKHSDAGTKDSSSEVPYDPEGAQRLLEQMTWEAEHDPEAYGRRAQVVREMLDGREFTSEEMRELCGFDK